MIKNDIDIITIFIKPSPRVTEMVETRTLHVNTSYSTSLPLLHLFSLD